MDIGIHNVRTISITMLFVENAHSLSLRIERDGDNDVDITLYGLSPSQIDSMNAAWGEPERCSYTHQQSVYPEEMKRLRSRVSELEAELAAATARGEREPA